MKVSNGVAYISDTVIKPNNVISQENLNKYSVNVKIKIKLLWNDLTVCFEFKNFELYVYNLKVDKREGLWGKTTFIFKMIY